MDFDVPTYPLVRKALAEQEKAFAHYDDGVPADLKKATYRAILILDETLDKNDPDHESILATSVLMNCPPYVRTKTERFGMEYSQTVMRLLDKHTNGDGVTPDDTDLIQIHSAHFVALGENLRDYLKNTKEIDRHWLDDMHETVKEYLDDRAVYEHKVLPGLLSRENALIAETTGLIDLKLGRRTKPLVQPKPKF